MAYSIACGPSVMIRIIPKEISNVAIILRYSHYGAKRYMSSVSSNAFLGH